MSMSYECWGYKDGKPWKMVHVTASSKAEAEQAAWQKFSAMNLRPDYINCK